MPIYLNKYGIIGILSDRCSSSCLRNNEKYFNNKSAPLAFLAWVTTSQKYGNKRLLLSYWVISDIIIKCKHFILNNNNHYLENPCDLILCKQITIYGQIKWSLNWNINFKKHKGYFSNISCSMKIVKWYLFRALYAL